MRIAMWMPLVIGVLGMALVAYSCLNLYRSLQSFADIPVTDTKEGILVQLGVPTEVGQRRLSHTNDADGLSWDARLYHVIYAADNGRKWLNVMPGGRSFVNFPVWYYERQQPGSVGTVIEIAFHGSAIASLACFEAADVEPAKIGPAPCPGIGGIGISDPEDKVYATLGEPNATMRDGTTQTLRYRDLGVDILVESGRVSAIRLHPIELHPLEFLSRAVRGAF